MPRFTLIVLLHVHSGHRDDYERFEAEASRIMARHGGRIERRLATHGLNGEGDTVPDEVHFVAFPSSESFAAYRSDPALTALADLRARAIRKTTILQADDLPRFQ